LADRTTCLKAKDFLALTNTIAPELGENVHFAQSSNLSSIIMYVMLFSLQYSSSAAACVNQLSQIKIARNF